MPSARRSASGTAGSPACTPRRCWASPRPRCCAAPASTRSWSTRWSAAASPRPASSPTTWSAGPGCTPGSPSTPAPRPIDAQCGSGPAVRAPGARHGGRRHHRRRASPAVSSRCPASRSAPTSRPASGDPRPDDWAIDMPNQFEAADRIAGRRGLTRERPRRVRPRLPAEGPGRGRRGPVQARDRGVPRRPRRRGQADRRDPSSTPTRGCATPPSRGWPASSRCCPTACTPPAPRRRSPTAPRPC